MGERHRFNGICVHAEDEVCHHYEDSKRYLKELTSAVGVVEEVESVLGAYVLPTLVYIRVKYAFHDAGYQEVDDLLAEIQKRLMPYRSEPYDEPKNLPGTPTTVEIISAAKEVLKYQKPYDSITPAGKAWDRLQATLDKPKRPPCYGTGVMRSSSGNYMPCNCPTCEEDK